MEKTKLSNRNKALKSHHSLKDTLISAARIMLSVLFIPLVWAVSLTFYREINLLEPGIYKAFISGIVSYVIIHLFFYEPVFIYRKSQEVTEASQEIFSPFFKFTSFLVPIFTIFLIALCILLGFIYKNSNFLYFLIFLIGTSFTLHLVFTAKALRSRNKNDITSLYIFSIVVIYVFNIILLGFGFSLIFEEFSFVSFMNESFDMVSSFFSHIFSQLFGV